LIQGIIINDKKLLVRSKGGIAIQWCVSYVVFIF